MIEKPKLLSDPPPYQRLRPGQLDNVGHAVMALAREVWVLTDRLAVVEALLEAKGIVVEAEVDTYQPGPEQESTLKLRRDRLIATIQDCLSGA
jgi:hypothetical protein